MNSVTEIHVDAYPLPRIDDSLDALSGSPVFSVFDLLSGYWQVQLSEDAKDKTTFITRSGWYLWKVLAMGLAGAPSTFEKFMERFMTGLQWKTLLIYLDDIIVFSRSEHQHLRNLAEVLKRLSQADLKIKVKKPAIFQSQVKYIGHIVSSSGVQKYPGRIKAIVEWEPPTSVKGVRSFLGTTSY